MCRSQLGRAPGYSLLLLTVLLAACAKRPRIDGLVLAVDPSSRTLTVSHAAIPGLMPAMAMPLQAAPGESIGRLHPGSRITFEFKGSSMRRIAVVETREIEDGLRLEPPPEKVPVGAPVPDFALTAEDGRTVRLSDYRGGLVAVHFIYTRCPLPEVCPRLTASFSSLQRRFRGRLTLLSITLDPSYDTPPVLAKYARSVRADPRGWRFLTGSGEDIAAVARRFGLIHWPEEGIVVHTSATALIGGDGRLNALVEGSGYRLEQMADLVQHYLTGGASPQ